MKRVLILCAVFALTAAQVSCEKSPSDTDSGRRTGGFAVVIDPAHGGPDAGTKFTSGSQEKAVTLLLAGVLAADLRAKGTAVTLTRTGDHFVSYPQRREIIRTAGADLVISLHAGLHTNQTGPQAVSVFYQAGNTGSVRLMTALHRTWQGSPALQGGESQPAHFLMLDSPVPSVILDLNALVETEGEGRLADPEFLHALSASLVRAVETYRNANISR